MGKTIGTVGDIEHKRILNKIINIGCKDKNPRPKYADGTPAHTLSYNGDMSQYDLSKGEFPIITLRPIATKLAIGEILWIYQDQTSDLSVLEDKYNVHWWNDWDIGNHSIGQVYGATVKRWNLANNLIKDIQNDPDGRRHIMSLWQEQDLREPHGLKPCAFLTIWNVRHGKDLIDYLDMMLLIRSNDFCAAGCINQVQYVVLQYLMARHLGYTPGIFTCFMDNIQIYDRHIDGAKELLRREPIECTPKVWLNPEKKDFYDFTLDDIKIIDYPMEEIKKKNPQIDDFKNNIGI